VTDIRALCIAAGLTPPAQRPLRDWRFDRQLPVIQALRQMQREKLLAVWVDNGKLRLQMAGDTYLREMSWEQAGRLVAEWRKER
jgi:hypothetical protein